ncbi:helix-turn-helix domain-containing protein [Methylobacterium radiodurans]|uniref:helix-turn-helix domain-containing protein n=1 Tax=Methylobacterium radiodurans TaxID=2202828 RepID=UPI0013A592F3|nr:helix-turn-helix domain-containing protein [Methylobacterium radiodurans]
MAPIFDARPVADTHVGASIGMRSYNLGTVLVGEVSAPAQSLERSARKAAAQGLDHVLVQYYRGGTSVVRTERGEAEVRPSDFVVYDLAQPISMTASAVTATNILLPRAVLGERIASIDGLHGCVFNGGRDAATRIFSAYLQDVVAHSEQLAASYHPGIAEAAAKLCCAALPAAAGDAVMAERRVSIEIRAFIQTHLGAPDLGPDMICERFGLSRATLYRQFAADDGVQNHIRNRRLARAMTLLTRPGNGRPRVSSIAYAVGFTDEKTFSRAFKRRFGFLPRDAATDRAVLPMHSDPGSMLGAWLRQLAA